MKKVMLTTGGTGGHIYPALAVADRLKIKGIEPVFVGSTERMEKDLVPDSGHRFIGIDISVPKGLKNIRKYLKAIRVAYKVIKEEKPDAIIGFGNYISVPVIIAGILLRKKIYLQEQNVNIGFAKDAQGKMNEGNYPNITKVDASFSQYMSGGFGTKTGIIGLDPTKAPKVYVPTNYIYVLKTADGTYAKVQVTDYYKDNADVLGGTPKLKYQLSKTVSE